jgi:hypothetical protein
MTKPRPCNCNRCAVDGPYEPGNCRLCWLWHNDPRYTKLWSGSSTELAKNVAAGPGSELKKLLAKLGITSFDGCGCESKVAQMNRWGVAGCRENFDTIRGWIAEAQAKAGWTTTITAAAKAATSGLALQLDPLDIPGSLVRLAIERAACRSTTMSEAP